MRMRARPYLHYAPVSGGVYFSGARAQLTMRGSEVLFKVADVCVPLLESGATEDELVAALGSERARPVVQLLTTGLRDHGMLLDHENLTVAEPPQDVRERHAGSIAYLESVCADPYAVFARLRAAKVALFGPPEVVRPAARGLTRAGVGQVVVPDSAASAGAYDDVDAAIWCCGPEAGDDESFVATRNGLLKDGIPIVPVLLDDRVLLAGPAIRDANEYPIWSAFRGRALDWARLDRLQPAARPVADALIGALAGQLLFKVLADLSPDGAAHLVHGAELVAEEVVLSTADEIDDGWRLLDEAEQAPMPGPEDAVESAGVVGTRWVGLFTRGSTEEDLPQLPLSLREIEYRADRSGSVFAWGADQQSATVGVALEALRRSCSGTGAGAAGLTEEHWLLDGALRLLAADAQTLDVASAEDLGPETFRIWQSFAGEQAGSCTIQLLHVPGLDWRLARVESTGTGRILGQAWAPEADSAIREALGTALADAQVQRVHEDEQSQSMLRTDSLVFAPDSTVESLRKQVAAHAAAGGISYRGRSRRADPVLGNIPFWVGPVEARQLKQESYNAR